jgi:hypothetical protein
VAINTKFQSNKTIEFGRTTIFSLLLLLLIPLSSCKDQVKGKLDVSTDGVPSGFTAKKGRKVAKTFVKKYGGDKFSVITTYATTNSLGDPNTDFSHQWRQLIGDIAQEKTVPKIEQRQNNNLSIVTGTGAVNFQGVNADAVLTNITANGRLITVSGIFNDKQGSKDYQTLIDAIGVDDALVNRTANSSVSPSNSNVDTASSVDIQKLFGRWTQYSYGGSSYAGGRTETPALSYTLNSDGTFGESKGAEIGHRFSKSGKYQISGNILKLIYKDGSVTQYSYKYRANTGKYTWDYLIMTKQGSNEEDYFVGREGK